MTTFGDVVGKVLGPESPWLLVLTVALLAAAAGVARRLTGSLRRIGERAGELERVTESERTRRRQVEAELTALGVRLPYWPPDGPYQPRPVTSASVADDGYDDEDPADDDDGWAPAPAPETDVRPIPVPPLPPAERVIAARHRR